MHANTAFSGEVVSIGIQIQPLNFVFPTNQTAKWFPVPHDPPGGQHQQLERRLDPGPAAQAPPQQLLVRLAGRLPNRRPRRHQPQPTRRYQSLPVRQLQAGVRRNAVPLGSPGDAHQGPQVPVALRRSTALCGVRDGVSALLPDRIARLFQLPQTGTVLYPVQTAGARGGQRVPELWPRRTHRAHADMVRKARRVCHRMWMSLFEAEFGVVQFELEDFCFQNKDYVLIKLYRFV